MYSSPPFLPPQNTNPYLYIYRDTQNRHNLSYLMFPSAHNPHSTAEPLTLQQTHPRAKCAG